MDSRLTSAGLIVRALGELIVGVYMAAVDTLGALTVGEVRGKG